jgi:hypothetical protein
VDLILDHTDTPESDLDRHAALPTQPLWQGGTNLDGDPPVLSMPAATAVMAHPVE